VRHCHRGAYLRSYVLTDMMRAGDHLLSYLPSIPMEESSAVHLGQVLGAFFGSLFVYSNYFHAIDLFEGGKGVRTVPGTASLFATYSVSSNRKN
jgi:glycerol uptake facilitator-like aquaporin